MIIASEEEAGLKWITLGGAGLQLTQFHAVTSCLLLLRYYRQQVCAHRTAGVNSTTTEESMFERFQQEKLFAA